MLTTQKFDHHHLQVRKRYFTNVDMESEEEFRPKFVEFLTDLMYSRCTDQFARYPTLLHCIVVHFTAPHTHAVQCLRLPFAAAV